MLTKKTFFLGLILLTFFYFSSQALAGGIFDGTTVGLPGPPGGVPQILANLLIWLVTIFGIIAMIGLVASGIQYVASFGNESAMEHAKKNMTYCIIGVVVGLSGWVIIKAIYAALTASSFYF